MFPDVTMAYQIEQHLIVLNTLSVPMLVKSLFVGPCHS
jgi:hypothetical protein